MMKAKNGPCTVNGLKTVQMVENLLFLKIFLEYNYVCCDRFCLFIFFLWLLFSFLVFPKFPPSRGNFRK